MESKDVLKFTKIVILNMKKEIVTPNLYEKGMIIETISTYQRYSIMELYLI